MTLYILIVTVVISIWAFNSSAVMEKLIFNAYAVSQRKQWYRFVTCSFVHGDWMHLIINMLVFYSFASQVEDAYGFVFGEKSTWYFLLLYFGGVVVSILPTFVQKKDDPGYNSLGASGGVSAVVFAHILFNPVQKIYLYGIIGLPGILMGLAYLVYSYYMNKKGGDNVNHNAHFWGAIFGVVYTLALKPSLFTNFIEQMKEFTLF